MQQITEELKVTEMKVQFLRGQLAGLEEAHNATLPPAKGTGEPKSVARKLLSTPAVSIGSAMRQGMIALREFTKNDVIQWVRSTYPSLEFSERSWGRPLAEMKEKGEVVLLKKNLGNKAEAVYGIKGKASAG